MHEHAHFPRTANSPSRLNSGDRAKFRDRIQDGCARCDLKYELFSLCLDRFGGLNGNFNHSYYCNTLLRLYLCLWPKAYLFWSAWYSANATATTAFRVASMFFSNDRAKHNKTHEVWACHQIRDPSRFAENTKTHLLLGLSA